MSNFTKYDNDDEEPILCLMESRQQNSSNLIDNILRQYHDSYASFDRNLIELIVKRHRERRNLSSCSQTILYARLQWLAIGLVIDRLFFWIYFAAIIISYSITLWLIPFSHPNLTIDIHKL